MDELAELKQQVADLTKKVEDFSSAATISDEFIEAMQKKGFVRISQTLKTPFTTLDGYSAHYYYMFSKIGEQNVVFSNIDQKDFTEITNINTSTDVFTGGNDFTNGDAFVFWSTGTTPSPIANGNVYYVRDVTSTTFKLTSTIGGTAINITTIGNGTHFLQRINLLY